MTQCWLRRSLPCFDGTHDVLLTPLRIIDIQLHERGFPKPAVRESGRAAPKVRPDRVLL